VAENNKTFQPGNEAEQAEMPDLVLHKHVQTMSDGKRYIIFCTFGENDDIGENGNDENDV
jgi:hypothetical protein